jgi:hypothetical protein
MRFIVRERGFSVAKAFLGAALMGPAGLVVGAGGRSNLEHHCESCGKNWRLKNGQLIPGELH